jgi:hypothetical protein
VAAERALGKARRRAGVRRVCEAASPFLAGANARGVAAYIAQKIGAPFLTREVTRFLTETKERGRASRISQINMGVGALMLRIRRSCDSALTDVYFASIWRLVDANRRSTIPLLVELAIIFRRNKLVLVSHQRLAESGFFDGDVEISRPSAVRMGRDFVSNLAYWWNISYLDRLAVCGYLYLFYTGSGQHSHAESVRQRCEELLVSFELDSLMHEEDAATLRNAYRRQVLGGAALCSFPPVVLRPDPLFGALAWADSMGHIASARPALTADHIRSLPAPLYVPNIVCVPSDWPAVSCAAI